jgi:hypothetical protein
MSKITIPLLTVALAAGCAVNNTQAPEPAPKPTGAPRQAKGKLPMDAANPPKTITAVKEMAGKPAVATRGTVSATGGFDLSLEVGIRYTFIITLTDGAMVELYADSAAGFYESWLPIGNSLDGNVLLDFGSVTIVDGSFVSSTVLLYIDWDEDGIADFDDPDDDNDGIVDLDDYDIDGDGVEDDYLDADGDGESDLADADDDNDGIPDDDDDDEDGDGIADADEDLDVDIDIDGDGDDDYGEDGEEGDDGGDGEARPDHPGRPYVGPILSTVSAAARS